MKFLWNAKNQSSIGADYLKARYKSTADSWVFPNSSLWAGLKSVLKLLQDGTKWLMDDGSSIHFWFDRWLSDPLLPASSGDFIDLGLYRKFSKGWFLGLTMKFI